VVPFRFASARTPGSSIELDARKPDQAAADAARVLGLMQAAVEPGSFSEYAGRAHLALARALEKQG
jgi:hypothetical protein